LGVILLAAMRLPFDAFQGALSTVRIRMRVGLVDVGPVGQCSDRTTDEGTPEGE
jgi:hypothetical protein